MAIDAAKLPGGDLSPSGEVRRSIRAGLAQLSEDVHDHSYRLHPSVLDDLGLVEALKAECDRVARFESVEVETERIPQNLPKDVALVIYRIAQEALRNIGRHARARTAKVSLALCESGLRLARSVTAISTKHHQPATFAGIQSARALGRHSNSTGETP